MERKVKSANDFDLLPSLKDIYGDLQFSKIQLNHFPNVLNLEIKIDDEKLYPSHNTNLNTFYPSGLSGFQNKLPIIISTSPFEMATKVGLN